MDIISARDIWKSHSDGVFVLKGVNLQMTEGDFVSVQGRSGAGKTTFLRIIALLEDPSKGELIVFGRPASQLGPEERSRIRLEKMGFVSQSLNLLPHLSARENIEVPLWLKKTDASERGRRATELLERFGLKQLADRLPAQMSLGEQQRVAVLRALANNPKLILADEPAAHLDEENAETLFELLKELNRELKMSVFVTTTSSDEASVATSRLRLSHGVLSKI